MYYKPIGLERILIGGPYLIPKCLVICQGGPGLIIDVVVSEDDIDVRLLAKEDHWDSNMLIL